MRGGKVLQRIHVRGVRGGSHQLSHGHVDREKRNPKKISTLATKQSQRRAQAREMSYLLRKANNYLAGKQREDG